MELHGPDIVHVSIHLADHAVVLVVVDHDVEVVSPRDEQGQARVEVDAPDRALVQLVLAHQHVQPQVVDQDLARVQGQDQPGPQRVRVQGLHPAARLAQQHLDLSHLN